MGGQVLGTGVSSVPRVAQPATSIDVTHIIAMIRRILQHTDTAVDEEDERAALVARGIGFVMVPAMRLCALHALQSRASRGHTAVKEHVRSGYSTCLCIDTTRVPVFPPWWFHLPSFAAHHHHKPPPPPPHKKNQPPPQTTTTTTTTTNHHHHRSHHT